MSKTKLDFKRLSISAKIERAKQIVAAVAENSNFPNPDPPLADITAVITKAETKSAERNAAQRLAKTKTTELNDCIDELEGLIGRIGAHVESVAGGDEAKIHSAGFETRAPAVSTSEPSQAPTSLDSTMGDHEGEIDAAWDTVAGAKSYVIEVSEDPPTPASWKHAGVSPRSKFTIAGLQSGKRYWIRVAAINTAGQSGWSGPATKIAP